MHKDDAGISHEQIAQKFVDSGAYNFEAMGRLITEIGPTLAVADKGWHGISIGKYNLLACFLTPFDLGRLGALNPSIAAVRSIESMTEGAFGQQTSG